MSGYTVISECGISTVEEHYPSEQAARDALRLMNFGGCGPGCAGPKFHYIRRHRPARRSVMGGLLTDTRQVCREIHTTELS